MVETIIGISLGTRICGIAVMRNRELILYKTKVFKGVWSNTKRREIVNLILKTCMHYEAKQLALRAINPLHTSKALDGLSVVLIKKVNDSGIKIHSYPLVKIRSSLNLARRQTIGEYVSGKYLELRKEYTRESNSFNKYYTRMFEAIAVTELTALLLKENKIRF